MTCLRAPCLLIVCAFSLAACGPTSVAVQHPIVTTTPPLGAPPGPTQAESGPTPPAFDRYGNANYDASGTYTGGHGVGTMVDNPDASSMGGLSTSMFSAEMLRALTSGRHDGG